MNEHRSNVQKQGNKEQQTKVLDVLVSFVIGLNADESEEANTSEGRQ